MPTIDPKTGQVTLTMQEFAEFSKSQAPAQGESSDNSLMGKWANMFKKKSPANQQTKPDNQNNRQQQQQQQQQKPANGKPQITRDALLEATKGMSFFTPTPEQLDAMKEGDFTGLVEAFNGALQNVFVDSALANNALLDRTTSSQRSEFEQMMQQQFGRYEAAKKIQSKTSDIMEFPGGDELVKTLTANFMQADPEASPEDVGERVRQFVTDFSSHFGQQAQKPNAREAQLQAAQQSATDF